MWQPIPVNYPAYSALWCQATVIGNADRGKPERRKVVAAMVISGGGGASKSGVPNRITTLAVQSLDGSAPNIVLLHETDTSPLVASAIAVDASSRLLAAAFDDNVAIFAIKSDGLAKLAQFPADFKERDAAVNTLAFPPPLHGEADGGGAGGGASQPPTPAAVDHSKVHRIMLATGGDDRSVRVFQLIITDEHLALACARKEAEAAPAADAALLSEEERKAKEKAERGKPLTPQYASLEETNWLQVDQVAQLQGHGAPIACVRWHPDPEAGQLLSASKDGTCRLWHWEQPQPLAVLQSPSGLPTAVAQSPRGECRSCAFCPSGERVYTVQHAHRQPAYIVRWALQAGRGGVQCVPTLVVKAADVPVTHMAVRPDGRRLAVGDSEGRVTLFTAPALVRMTSYAAHDLPVTALAFAALPKRLMDTLGSFDLISSSPDNKRLTMVQSAGNGLYMIREIIKWFWRVFTLLLGLVFRAGGFACAAAAVALLALLGADHFTEHQSQLLM